MKLCISIVGVFLSFAIFGQSTFVVGANSPTESSSQITIKFIDDATGETVPGTTVYVESIEFGTAADIEGKVLLNLKNKTYLVRASSIGYVSIPFILEVKGNGTLTLRLVSSTTQLDEIIIEADPDANVNSTEIGKNTLSIETIEGLPQFVGEVDILKSIVLLPGISSVGEASSGFNVRGGGFDQNLILLGGAPLYNPSHLFGFFSSFNSDFIDEVSVFKGGIPANYGGRASSILDLTYKSGDFTKWKSKVSAGLISTKMNFEGPIIKDKLSVLFGGRLSYSDWLLKAIKSDEISNSSAQFYDVNAIVDFKLNSSNILKYSFYQSHDDFRLLSDTTFNWTNRQHVLTLSGQPTSKLFYKVSAVSSTYEYAINNKFEFNGFNINSSIHDTSIKFESSYDLKEENTISFGADARYYLINPGDLIPDANSSVNPVSVEAEQGAEISFFGQHEIALSSKIGLSYGLRYARFTYLGPNSVNRYEEFLPISEENISGQDVYDKNETINSYDGLEPRLALRFTLNPTTSIKLGYNRLNQFIHLISNTSTIAPTDTWKLSDPLIKPQISTQYSLGFFKNFFDNKVETSIEVFYKDLENIIEYKDGAVLILNSHPETELVNGTGRAYGLELYLKRKVGRLTGWISYTYSRSLRTVVGSYPEELVNQGLEYPANYDKPHDLTATTEYKITPRTKFSAIFTYSVGRPVTYPSAKLNLFGEDISYYDSRNQHRSPDYHRLDVSMTFEMNGRSKLSNGDIVFSVYNVYARKNAFSVFFDDIPGAPPQAYKLSVVGTAFPSLSYNFKPF